MNYTVKTSTKSLSNHLLLYSVCLLHVVARQSEMLRPTTGIAQRTHTRPIAPAADGRDYSLVSPHPYLKIQILTDHSSAAFNGASEVFPPGTLSSNLCTEHARGRWLDASANKALFKQRKIIPSSILSIH